MAEPEPKQPIQPIPQRIRWWPAVAIVVLVLARILWARLAPDLYFQQRNLETSKAVLAGSVALGLWWLFLSRVRWRWRILGVAGCLVPLLLVAALFRVRGVSGDLLPILEFRWQRASPPLVQVNPDNLPAVVTTNGPWFSQFLGSNRDGVLPDPRLETNWTAHPPQILWRHKAGPAWSGFAVAGDYAITQEQRGKQECVVAYELTSGRQLWLHQYNAHYRSPLAGEGPRATPAIAGDRVFAMGATGLLTCLSLTNGQMQWAVDVLAMTGSKLPDWGMASAPLVVGGLVVVHSGENSAQSIHAFSVADGKLPIWSAANTSPGYASPISASLAGVPQILAFNSDLITSHDPVSGTVLWSHPWGNGNAVCSSPVVVNSNQVLFSSGYGYGAELLEVTNRATGLLVTRLWKSPRLKSKFGHVFVHDGCAMGLDDGVFAAADLADGSLRWKEGRYGHGQGLLVGDLYLLMAEAGELVLLRPTRDAPNELAHFRVFNAKTWNPIALAGDLLLVRNDQEVACIRLPVSGVAD